MAIAPRTATELVRDIPLLAALPESLQAALADKTELRKVARKGALFSEGEPAEGLWVVRTGEVKVVKHGRDGREQIIYLVRPGKLVTEGLRFDGGAYSASAVAMRAASALVFPNDVLRQLGQKEPQLLAMLVDIMSKRAERTLDLVSDLSLRTVPARLASFICTLVAMRESKGQDSRNLVRDLTTETVAGRLGTVREEISRGLAQLEKKGALKVSPDLIEVVDIERLEELAFGKKAKSGEVAS